MRETSATSFGQNLRGDVENPDTKKKSSAVKDIAVNAGTEIVGSAATGIAGKLKAVGKHFKKFKALTGR